MRLAICTPFHATSAIARVSRVVAEELARHADVDIWYDPRPGPGLATALPTQPWLGDVRSHEQLRSYDAVVYSMGDQWANHGAVYEALSVVPGIVVMHDLSLANFFADKFLRVGDRRGYLEAIERYHGAQARAESEAGFASTAPHRWHPGSAVMLTELALENALGVITHSEFAAAHMRSTTRPLRVLALPFAKARETRPIMSERADRPEPVSILLFGHVNRARRADAVIRAIASSPDLAGRVTFTIAGAITIPIQSELEREVEAAHLEESVHLAGYLDDNELHATIESSDICICLRQPALEAASASLVEAMWHGKPAVVSASGWYRELPDDCVVRIDGGQGSLQAALRMLVNDPGLRRRIGDRARTYAQRCFVASHYADGLRELIVEALGTWPILHMEAAVETRLEQLGMADPGPARSAVSRSVNELFGARLPVGAARPHRDGTVTLGEAFDVPALVERACTRQARARTSAVLGRLAPDDVNMPAVIDSLEAPAPAGSPGLHAFLNAYGHEVRPRTYLEVGVRRGWSMAQITDGAPNCRLYGVDLWVEDYADASNPGPAFVETELRAQGHAGSIRLATGDSHEVLPHLRSFGMPPGAPDPWPDRFDCVVIDGDHRVEGALRDLRDGLELVKPGGLLVFDDLDYEGDERHYNPATADPRTLLSVWREVEATNPEFDFWTIAGRGAIGIARRR